MLAKQRLRTQKIIIRKINFNFSYRANRLRGSSPVFSPSGEIYGLIHVGRQPEREICGEKRT